MKKKGKVKCPLTFINNNNSKWKDNGKSSQQKKKEYCDMNVVKEKRNLKEYKIRDDGFGLNEIYLRLRKN